MTKEQLHQAAILISFTAEWLRDKCDIELEKAIKAIRFAWSQQSNQDLRQDASHGRESR